MFNPESDEIVMKPSNTLTAAQKRSLNAKVAAWHESFEKETPAQREAEADRIWAKLGA